MAKSSDRDRDVAQWCGSLRLADAITRKKAKPQTSELTSSHPVSTHSATADVVAVEVLSCSHHTAAQRSREAEATFLSESPASIEAKPGQRHGTVA